MGKQNITKKKRLNPRKSYSGGDSYVESQGGETGKEKKSIRNLSRKIKKENCSPYAHDKNHIKGSCFTNGSLMDLKRMYNLKHPKSRIRTNHPVNIWKQLEKKTRKEYKCNKESCWINHLADSTTKTKLKSLLFSPPQPEEWKKNPVTWLSNYDILNVLRQYEKTFPHFYFIGPSAIDYNHKDDVGRCVCPNLCNFDLSKEYQDGKRKIGVIFNLDPHYKGGSHWVSLFIDLDDQFVFYFDSTAEKIPKLINGFASHVIQQGREMSPAMDLSFHQNNQIEHQRQNTECGMYSLFFIITLLIREKDGAKLSKKDIFKLFKGGKRIPDSKMEDLRDVFFNKRSES